MQPPQNCENGYGVPEKRRDQVRPGLIDKSARVPGARTAPGGNQASSRAAQVRVATLNVGSLTGRSIEVAEALERRWIDICAVQETRWAGKKSKDIGRGFKCVYNGKPKTTNGVGIIIADRFRNAIAEVQRYDDRLMKIIFVYERRRLHFFSAYASQAGCAEAAKDAF